VLHLLSGSLLGRGLGFVLNLLLSRSLGPSGLGLFSLVLSTAQTFELTARGGVDYGLSCALTGPEANLNVEQRAATAFSALRLVQLATLALAAALWVWVMPLGGLLPSTLPLDRKAVATSLVVIASLEALGGLPWDLFLIAGQTRLVSLRQGLFAPLKLLGAWLGGLMGGAGGALLGYGLVSTGQTCWLLHRCQSLLPWPPRWLPHWEHAWNLVRIGAPLYGTNAISSLVFLPLLAGVAKTQGIADVGYLRVGQIVVQLFTLLPGALAPLLFLRLRQSISSEQAGQDTELSLRLIWWLGLASLLLYLLLDRSLVGLFFGERFLPSLQPTRLLVLAAVLESVNQVLHTPLLAKRRTMLFAIGQNVPALLAAALGWLLIPEWGLAGFMIAKLVFALGPVLIYLTEGWNRFQNKRMVTLLMLATAAITPLCWWPAGETWWQSCLTVGVIAVLAREGWPLRRLLRAP
jgi:O-antigen/teichoic acid export membrane protein